MITVSIIENEREYADSLAEYLNRIDGLKVLSVHYNAEAFIGAKINTPDIFLTDTNLGEEFQSGIEFISMMRGKFPNLLFLVLTIYDEDEKVFNALRAGANGYILKSSKVETISAALKELYDGGAPMSPHIARKVTLFFNQTTTLNKPSSHLLSERENEIIQLIANGKMEKEVAAELYISINTVKNHISKIYQKLHVNSRVEALNKYFGR